MIQAIRRFFDANILGSANADDHQIQQGALRLATAALLVEMTRADAVVKAEERVAVDQALRELFEIDETQVRDLVTLAEQEVVESSSLFQFTNLIDKQFSYEQKVSVVEMMWRVAFSDTCKDQYEEYLVRKVADLLHVAHRDFIRARHRVEDQLGPL
jgi:uncharacterized tellurite resistance protein B-like protein